MAGKRVQKFDRETLYKMYIEQDMTSREIAKALNSTQRSVQTTLSFLGIKKGREQAVIVLTRIQQQAFEIEAHAREIDVNELVRRMFNTIIQDNLFTAILDDEDDIEQ